MLVKKKTNILKTLDRKNFYNGMNREIRPIRLEKKQPAKCLY